MKMGVVAALGASVLAVIVFEIVLNVTSLFNHSNLNLPGGLDRVVRRVLVTPDMHRVHHSMFPSETNTNFGFSFSWWDRLFGTYRDQPAAGHERMAIGLRRYREAPLGLAAMIAFPVTGEPGSYPLSRGSRRRA